MNDWSNWALAAFAFGLWCAASLAVAAGFHGWKTAVVRSAR